MSINSNIGEKEDLESNRVSLFMYGTMCVFVCLCVCFSVCVRMHVCMLCVYVCM